MQITELVTKHNQIKNILQGISEIERSKMNFGSSQNAKVKKHCQNCSGNCQGLSQEILTKWEEMSNPEEWSDITNDPDFSWADYCVELKADLVNLSKEFPVYQDNFRKLFTDLNLVENQGEGYDPE